MPRNKAPYRNKMKTPAKTTARIALDLIDANEKKETTFNANSYIGRPPSTPDPDSILHDILSTTHEDTDPAAAVLGDIITAQAGPLWSRLAKGTEGQVLTMVDADTPDWADTTALSSSGPTSVDVGEQAIINCGAVTDDPLDFMVVVNAQNVTGGPAFTVLQSMARVAGRITYNWTIDAGDLNVNIYNDSEVDTTVMVWYGSPTLVACECPFGVRVTAINTDATTADKIIRCTAGGITVTLYTAVGNTGYDLYIDNDSVGIVTVDGNGAETIEGELTQALVPDTSIHIYSTGAGWRII